MVDDVGQATLSLVESLIEQLQSLGALDSEDVAIIYERAIERVRERRDAGEFLALELQSSLVRRRSG
jgi:hypothetical protein